MTGTKLNRGLTKREFHDLKPHDTIRLNGNWHKVFDAYPIGNGRTVVKVIKQGTRTLETITFDSTQKATCKA